MQRPVIAHDVTMARAAQGSRTAAEGGDIIVAGLLKIVVVLLVFGLVVYEAGAVAVNYMQLDDLAGQAVRAGASTPPQQRTAATVERAMLAELEGSGADLDQFEVDPEGVSLTISRQARVLVLDRLGPLADVARAERTKRAVFR